MPRRPRCDEPGRWHHVTARGIAKRTIFESRADLRYFLSCLARAVRRGLIEVHAYCLLTNHFHLLVRSPTGQLSEAMRWVLHRYVRNFNRTRGRDGPLFKGRFFSKHVKTLAYRRIAVRYIDDNVPDAGLAAAAREYRYSSAWSYVRRRGPPWLSRGWVESMVSPGTAYEPHRYEAMFPTRLPPAIRASVERYLRRGNDDHVVDPEDLLGAAPTKVRAHFMRCAKLADGTRPAAPMVAPELVDALVAEAAEHWGDWRIRRGSRQVRVDAWDLARPALLQALSGLSQQAISVRLGVPRSTVQSRLRAHEHVVRHDVRYGTRYRELVSRGLEQMGSTLRSFGS